MPTFYSARPRTGIAQSVRALLSSSPNLSEADMVGLEKIGAQTDRSTALAEKARLEVEQLQEADRLRKSPAAANEYAGVVSGLPGGDLPRRLGGYVRGETIPPTFPKDDEGNPMPAASYARPDVTPEQERGFRSAIGSLIANQLATGKTNAEQLTHAGGNLLTQAVRSAIAAAPDVPAENRLGHSIGIPAREPFSRGPNAQGVIVNQETGDISTEPLIHGAAVKALDALGVQRGTPRPGTAGAAPKPPAGYRLNEDGELEPIPGGAADTRNTQALERKVTAFSGQMEKTNVPQFEQALRNIEGEIAKYKEKENLPGVGMSGNMPQFLVSREGQKLRQAIATIKNIELKDRSGQAVTDNEMKRFLEELGGVITSDAQIRDAIKNVRNRFDSKKQNIVAGVGDDVLKLYTERGGVDFKRGGPLREQESGWSIKRVGE